MKQITEIEREYMQKDSRTFYTRVLCNGKEVSGVFRNYIQHKGSCGSYSFQPQSIFSSYADIYIDYCEKGLVGKKIELQDRIKVGNDEYWHTVGTYYVNSAPTKGEKTTLEALGVISAKMGRKFSGGTYTTVSALLERLAEVAGCTITLADGLEDLEIPETDLTEWYYREVLGMVAGLYFGYATEDDYGNIIIDYFKTTGEVITASLDRMSVEPDFYE